MLDDYKKLFQDRAEAVKDWETMDKSQLCRECLANEHSYLYDNYVAALICRYWGLISKFYASSTNLAEPEDCYNWLIDSIMYALKHRQWENPEANIYNDPKGPDKVINRCMKSSRLIFYQFKNRKKRRKEYQFVSIEAMREEMNTDSIDLEDESARLDDISFDVPFIIEQTFRKKEYFLAFILDCICIEDVFDSDEAGHITFNIKRLARYFRQIDDKYVKYFANKYNLEYDQVYQAAILAKNVPDSKLTVKIEDTLLRLKHSEIVKNLKNMR